MITKEHQALVDALRELRLERGQPSLRSITDSTGGTVSHTTIGDILNGVRLPRWKKLAVIVATAGNLDILLYEVADANARDRELVSQCKRCRNSLLYLMRPGGASVERVIHTRIRALHINHEGHDDAQSFDDAVPQFT